MQAYTEILPPSGVTHAVQMPLLGLKSHNLIVAKTSLLQVFETRLIDVLPVENKANHGLNISPVTSNLLQKGTSTPPAQMKLVLVGEYELFGIITSLAAVKALNTKSGGQALLISFKNAKISLVEWDPEIYGLSTVSIHFYENEDLQGSPWGPELGKSISYLIVDPSSRCAALKFGQRSLAILPFRQAGDDLTMEDYEPDLDSARLQTSNQSRGKNGAVANEHRQTPYASSFVLSLTALDPNLLHPIDIAFLFEYREPTLGVLSSTRYPSTYLNPERKDSLSYTVFTLDLEQRARTPLLSVGGLPYDLHKLVPLPLPVGGTLLIGGNEIIHVDQSGKTNAIAVNEFAKHCSAFPMLDQSDLALRLERCVVVHFNRETGAMLMVLNNGDLAMLSFRLDGRTVSGISLQRVSKDHGGELLLTQASCAVYLGHGSVFVGSHYSDAVVLNCGQKGSQLSRKRSHAAMMGNGATKSDEEEDEEDEEEEVDDDDLYSNNIPTNQQLVDNSSIDPTNNNIIYTVQDRLINLSPAGEPVLGLYSGTSLDLSTISDDLELVLPIGLEKAGAIAFLNREIQLNELQNIGINHAINVWPIKACKNSKNDSTMLSINGSVGENTNPYDQFLVINGMDDEKEVSTIYAITASGLEECTGTDFEADTMTINADVLCKGSRIVQISSGEIRCYDPDLSLAQIIPMVDEKTDAELKILHSSFADPYVLVVRDDSSVVILKAEENGDVEEIDNGKALTEFKWVSGCLCKSKNTGSQILAYLLNADGGLHIFEMPNLTEPIYIAENLRNLPFILSSEQSHRRPATADALVEILACDLGTSTAKSLHLIVRSAGNDVTIYEPFQYPKFGSGHSFAENLRWRKIPLPTAQYNQETSLEIVRRPLRSIRIGDYAAVLWPGNSMYCIMKAATSLPKLMRIKKKNLSAISSFHAELCQDGLVVIDDTGSIKLCRLPADVQYGETGWAVQRLFLDETVIGLSYQPETGLYVAALNATSSFTLPEDEWHQEWATESRLFNPAYLSFKPVRSQGMLKLINPKSRSIIHEFLLEEDETILCIKTLDLEISEKTHERKTLLAVGTGIIRGEDYSSNGSIYIFDVISVVPEVDQPETNMALKRIVREETKGAVTSIADIGDEGFLLHSQGQKCMIRGLKEDNSLLPIAFMDMQCYVTSLKSVPGTGLVLMADALKGVWFTGFLNEPYTLKLFGKSNTDMEVVVADFLPWGKQLFLLVADTDCYLHVLEFNPENPKSLSGQRLIPKSSFHTGHYPVSMTLLPSTSSPANNGEVADDDFDMSEGASKMPPPQLLVTMQSGAIALVSQLDEQTYRRLGALQTYLTGILDHPCGLNSRAHRSVESEGFGGRGILDGQVLTRFNEINSLRKAEACGRVGVEAWQMNADINFINGSGLQYL